MFNHELANNVTMDQFLKLGFVKENDGPGDPRGTDWNYRNDNFHILINAYFDVCLCRLNHPSDWIEIKADDVNDLQNLLDFVND